MIIYIVIPIVNLPAVLLTDTPINSTAVDNTPQFILELSQISAPQPAYQPGPHLQVHAEQEEQSGVCASLGAGAVTSLALQDMIITAAAGNPVASQESLLFLCHCGKECTR